MLPTFMKTKILKIQIICILGHDLFKNLIKAIPYLPKEDLCVYTYKSFNPQLKLLCMHWY